MKLNLVSVSKIWDAAPHNAFTDLAYFKQQWFCAFREASDHASEDGKIRVIHSHNGRDWENTVLFSSKEKNLPDLRDPKIKAAPDGRLILMAAATSRDTEAKRRNYIWFSENGTHWVEDASGVNQDMWLWSLACGDDAIYSAGYGSQDGVFTVSLFRKKGGSPFERLTTLYADERSPNETALLFHEGKGLALIRREFAPGQTSLPPYNNGTALLATAQAPFLEWRASDLGIYVGGPALLRLPDGTIIAGGRKIASGHYMALWEVDVVNRKLDERLILPSGNDCSYPGLVWQNDRLWVSYYSHHESKSGIYFAEIEPVDL